MNEETIQGPQQKSSANLRAMSKDLIWMHITKEEYDHLPGVLEHHQEDLDGHLGVKKITEIPSNLRRPWRHISLSQHPLQAITSTSWLISEGRLYTASVEQSHLICFKPSTWNLASAFKDELINSWSRHGVGNHLQVIHQAYILHQDEVDSSRVFTIKGNFIQDIFGAFTLLGIKDIFGTITSHIVHCLATPETIKQFTASIKDSARHAGLYIVDGLPSDEASQGFVNACIMQGINMKAPQNSIKERYRGHQDHSIYVLKNNLENIEKYASVNTDHPSVPSHQTEDQDEEMASGDVKHPCGSITHQDGTVSIPLEFIQPVETSNAS